jgi:hypothetical protein
MEEYVLDAVVASVELVVPGLGPLAGMLAGLAGDLAGAGAADREFLELWHEGEQPSTPWGTDRRVIPQKHETTPPWPSWPHAGASGPGASKPATPARQQQRSGAVNLGMSGAELVRRYEAGESLAQLVAAAGASKDAVRYRLKAQDAKMRPVGTPPALSRENEQALCRACTWELLTVDQCAKKFKISRNTAMRILDQRHIKRRPGGIQPAKGGTKARQPPGRRAQTGAVIPQRHENNATMAVRNCADVTVSLKCKEHSCGPWPGHVAFGDPNVLSTPTTPEF